MVGPVPLKLNLMQMKKSYNYIFIKWENFKKYISLYNEFEYEFILIIYL